MKIRLQGSLGVYGVESFVQGLASHLRQMNIEVSVTPPFGRFLVRGRGRASPDPNVSAESHSSSGRSGVPDLIHLNYAFASLPLVLRPSRPPLLYTVHGVPRPYLEPELRFKLGYMLENTSLKLVASHATRVVAISQYVQDLLRRSYGIRSDVIRNGVDTVLFQPISPEDKPSLRASLSVPADEKMILFIARLYPYKDPLTLVRCMPDVISKNENAVFTIIGDGPLKTVIMSEIARMGLQRYVRLIPYLPRVELVKWFQAADTYVSTAPAEMLGFSVLEAMSCGIPVVAADSGGPVEVLGESGTFFKARDEVDLAEKVLEIIRDQGLGSTRGRAGRLIVLKEFRWSDIAAKYVNVYESMI